MTRYPQLHRTRPSAFPAALPPRVARHRGDVTVGPQFSVGDRAVTSNTRRGNPSPIDRRSGAVREGRGASIEVVGEPRPDRRQRSGCDRAVAPSRSSSRRSRVQDPRRRRRSTRRPTTTPPPSARPAGWARGRGEHRCDPLPRSYRRPREGTFSVRRREDRVGDDPSIRRRRAARSPSSSRDASSSRDRAAVQLGAQMPSRSSISAGAIGSSMCSQITVRSLGSGVEAHAMVDDPDAPVGSQEGVPPFAVGVVDDHVEERDLPERVRGSLGEREVMLLGVELDERLHRSQPFGSLAQDRGGNVGPPERARNDVGGDLTPAQRPFGEVPHGHLAAPGLVDGERAVTVEGCPHQEGVVGGVRAAAPGSPSSPVAIDRSDRGVAQAREECPFIAGHA